MVVLVDLEDVSIDGAPIREHLLEVLGVTHVEAMADIVTELASHPFPVNTALNVRHIDGNPGFLT